MIITSDLYFLGTTLGRHLSFLTTHLRPGLSPRTRVRDLLWTRLGWRVRERRLRVLGAMSHVEIWKELADKPAVVVWQGVASTMPSLEPARGSQEESSHDGGCLRWIRVSDLESYQVAPSGLSLALKNLVWGCFLDAFPRRASQALRRRFGLGSGYAPTSQSVAAGSQQGLSLVSRAMPSLTPGSVEERDTEAVLDNTIRFGASFFEPQELSRISTVSGVF
jgi:hypothetical protein